MQQRMTSQERIYKDILTRMIEGEFSEESALPTLEELKDFYHVGNNCIRAVIVRLKEAGYLSTKRGRPARIVYPPNASEAENDTAIAALCGNRNLHSTCKAVHILFPSIYTHASLACTEIQLAELSRLVPLLPAGEEDCTDDIDPYFRFFRIILSSIQNRLILQIIDALMQDIILPTALEYRRGSALQAELLQSTAVMRRIYAAILMKDAAVLKNEWEQVFAITERMFLKTDPSYEEDAAEEHGELAVLPYAEEFKYLIIAHALYEQIMQGEFPVGTFLPAISQARTLYQAGKITIQSAYRVLADLGLVHTIHGRGTEVIRLTIENTAAVDKETAHQRKQNYREAIAFLQIIYGDILLYVRDQTFQPLKLQLESALNPSHQYSALILCRYLMKESCGFVLDTFYQMISRRLYWGVYFGGTSGGSLLEEKHTLCVKIADALEQRQSEQASALTNELLHTLCHSV